MFSIEIDEYIYPRRVSSGLYRLNVWKRATRMVEVGKRSISIKSGTCNNNNVRIF